MDFKFEGDEKSFHVLNAVSPAFTCAEPFSKLIVKNIKSKLNQLNWKKYFIQIQVELDYQKMQVRDPYLQIQLN